MDSQPVRRDDNEPMVGKDDASAGDGELLKEIREDFSYFRDFWRDNFEEMKTDLRFIAGDPWPAPARSQREENHRPVLCPDELGQYQNATINNLRQNKRAIKVTPRGSGATDKDAERRSAIIKGIEYKSNAQGAYTNAFENQINCGMGFFRVTTKKISSEDEVEPRIKGIENPLSVLLDPNAKEPDFSDQKRCFVFDVIRKRDFKRQYPNAQKQSFTGDDMTAAPDWFQAENILVAEYWRIDGYDDDGENGKVTQYITNGVEILRRTPWPGSWIPIIPAMGKKVYKPTGSEMKRFYYSQIRLARDAATMLAYVWSQEAEEYGMTPRAPLIGYVGQFEKDREAFENLNTVPRAFVEIDPTVDGASGQILPLPTRLPFTPNAQAYEIGKESARRQVQASMGISPLPSAAQRQNEKSGVALEKIQNAQAIGSFHFTDNFDRAIENAGRQLDELITLVMDTARQVSTRQADETHSMIHVVPNGQQPPTLDGTTGQPINPEDVLDPKRGDFDVTISTGMSYQSQREQASEFADTLIGELGNLPLAPQQKASLLALAISLKDIGPIGDQIAQLIDPSAEQGPIPPQVQQQMGQMQHQVQMLQQALAQAGKELEDLKFDQKAQITKHQGDMELQQLKNQGAATDAEISTKAQNLQERMAFIESMMKQMGDQAHEAAMSAQEHEQALQQGQQQTQNQGQLQDQQAQNQSAQSAQDAQQAQEAQPAGGAE